MLVETTEGTGRERCPGRTRRHRFLAVLAVAALLGTVTGLDGPVDAAPTPPPAGYPVVAYGSLPPPCVEGDPYLVSFNGLIWGYAWSPLTERWVSAPYCRNRWSNIGVSPPVAIRSGGTATFSLQDGTNQADYIPTFGGASWTGFSAGEVVAGCTTYDVSCTLRIGDPDQEPVDWTYREIGLAAPQYYITWIPQVGCTEITPCAGATTRAWTAVGVQPGNVAPDAGFTWTVDGGEVAFTATSTDPLGLELTHQWDLGDGTTSDQPNPRHVYVDPGRYAVTLTSTNTLGLSDTVTTEIDLEGEPLQISDLVVDPSVPVAGEPASIRFTVANEGDDPVTAVRPTVTAQPPDILGVDPAPISPFTLAAGASRTVEVDLVALRGGEARITVGAGGVVGSEPTQARVRSILVDVEGPALGLTVDAPATPPRQGEEFEVSVQVRNLDGRPVADVVPTLVAEPSDRVEISGPEPGDPVSLAPSGEPGDTTTFTWKLTADRTAAVELEFTAVGQVDDGEVRGEASETVELESDLTFTWELAPRYAGDFDAVLSPAEVNTHAYEFTVTIGQVNGTSCSGNDTFVFQADGDPLPVQRQIGTCVFRFTKLDVDPFDLEAARVVDDVIDSVGEDRLEPRDFFIVAIGDSLSSGEGSPRGEAPIWTDRQCHRSALAGGPQAARLIEDADPHSVVTFLHLACSGANTPRGLTGSYGGMEAGPTLRPQIPEIARFADGREIDAVVMSVGANDLEFGRVVKSCLNLVTLWECYDSTIDGVPVPDFVNTRLQQLPDTYARNAAWLQQAGVAPERVYSLDYPNSTRDEDGVTCTAGDGPVTFTQAEWAWNEANVLQPLNLAVMGATVRHGWRGVHGFADLFERHGYCSSDSWITSLLESLWSEYLVPDGGWHPNATGYQQYAARIAEELQRDLFVDGKPRPAEEVEGPAVLAEDTAPGADRVELRGDRFTIGDRVVIDPGTGTAEVRTIVAKGSLVFDRPLIHPHLAGTMIVLDGELPGALDLVAGAPEQPPAPVRPGPGPGPGPVTPGPVDPGPVDPGPVDPGPVDPGPVDPRDPTDPTDPVTPVDPADPTDPEGPPAPVDPSPGPGGPGSMSPSPRTDGGAGAGGRAGAGGSSSPLPRTGSASWPLVAVALALIAAGASVTGRLRWSRR